MNRFLMVLILFGAICSVPLCDLPEEEIRYRREIREETAEYTETEDSATWPLWLR